MRPNDGTCQRWRASTFAVFGMAAFSMNFFLRLTAASQAETKTETNADLPGVLCDEADTSETWNETMSVCDLRRRLSALNTTELEGVLEYMKGQEYETPKKEPPVNKETFIWALLIYGITKTAQRSLIAQVLSFVLTQQRPYKCYATVGCFSPENRMGLEIGGPVSPEEASVKFYYYTNQSRLGREVNLTNWENATKDIRAPKKPLTVIIHGFKESCKTKQVVKLRDSLLTNVECDVIVVDWKGAAAFPYYGAAAANSPMAGAELSVLLQSMYTKLSLDPEKVHLIGFSLGAHAAGCCGRHFHNYTRKKLGRITGLDPAGLLFENTNVSLSAEDATFVDVIHTNGGNITDLKFGTKNAIGQVDFYPNGGSHQPGCPGGFSQISCSHNRAWWLFIESVETKNCTFKSVLCGGGVSPYDVCLERNSSVSAEMGFHSDSRKVNGSYYLKTRPDSPYCILHESPSDESTSTTVTDPPRLPR